MQKCFRLGACVFAVCVIASSPALSADVLLNGNIKDGAVTTAKLANGAITSVKIAIGAVTTGRIKPGAVISSRLGSAAVTSYAIKDGAVTVPKLNASVMKLFTDLTARIAQLEKQLKNANMEIAKLKMKK